MLADILIDPDRGIAHAKQSRCGTSNYRVDGEKFWMQTTARGIKLSRRTGDGAERCEVLAWSAVARFAHTLPAGVVANVRARRQELIRHARAQPACPLGASDEERQRWERDIYRPWLASHWDAKAQLEAALDAAILGSVDAQPALFDLTTARHVRPPTRRTSPSRESTRAGQDRLL